jgi:membrane protein YdbS with pleckstrin-like domain
MQPITPAARLPRSADRILLPHEQRLIIIRRHPVVLAGPIAAVIAAPAVIVTLVGWLNLNSVTLLILWLAWFVLLLRVIWKVVSWRSREYIVTPERILFINGVLARDVTMIPIARISDITFQRSAMGRILGYGSFIIQLFDTSQAIRRIDFLPYPEQLYIEVTGIIFEEWDG